MKLVQVVEVGRKKVDFNIFEGCKAKTSCLNISEKTKDPRKKTRAACAEMSRIGPFSY